MALFRHEPPALFTRNGVNLTATPMQRRDTGAMANGTLLIVGAAAFMIGVYGRFKGIGLWPLSIDEFYMSRSIDNVLRTGFPAFPCGGYYTRGLLYQYAVAGLRLGGLTPETAGRFITALSSLAMLPAIFLLAKRVQGAMLGWLVVGILCLSVWEIEMARFARMYAPFQALFAWYLVAYMNFAATRRIAALVGMVVLSVLGVLIWEGGFLLGLANLWAALVMRENGPLKSPYWLRFMLLGLLLVPLYLATRDLRIFADMPVAGVVPATTSTLFEAAISWFAAAWLHPVVALSLVIPLILMRPAAQFIGAQRDRPLAAISLGLVLLAAALHAFLVSAAILLLALLQGVVDRRSLASRGAGYFWLAVGAFLVCWAALDLLSDVAPTLVEGSPFANGPNFVRQLFGFPNVYRRVLFPWARTVPILTTGLAATFLYLCWQSIRERWGPQSREAAIVPLLSLVVVLVLAVGVTPTDRIETRYTFFLYPLLMLLAVHAVLTFARSVPMLRRAPVLLTTILPLICFAGTEDFQPRHVLAVDSAKVNYRVGMPGHRVEHYYPRNDISGVAQWLAAEVKPGDVVIAGIPSLDQYYRHIDYFFLTQTDVRYEAYVCPDGRTERWTNRPVLYGTDALASIVAGHRVFASVYGAAERELKEYGAAAGWSVSRAWIADSGTADVLLIEQRPASAR